MPTNFSNNLLTFPGWIMTKSSELVLKKNSLFGGSEAEYNLEYRGDVELEKWARFFVNEIVGEKRMRTKQIVDLKGRDRENLIGGVIEDARAPLADELLYVSGTVEVEDQPMEDPDKEGDKPKSESSRTRRSFEISLLTPFLEFVAKSIKHGVIESRNGDLPEDLTLPGLLSEPTCQLKCLRLGLDVFSQSFFSMLGVTPVVTQTLLVEARSDLLRLRISAEKLPARQTLPLERESIFQKFSLFTQATMGFAIEADYISKF